ncbi:2125_t:CDS:2, partial [Acaulospora colombiana]
MPVSSTATGLHWQVSQATSLAFVKVIMSQDPSTNHQGVSIPIFFTRTCISNYSQIFMENGSGGLMSDLEFVHSQERQVLQQPDRHPGNLELNIQIENCGVGIEIKTGGTSQDNQNTPIFVRTTTDQPNSLGGSIIIDNAQLTNVPIAVGTSAGATTLAGSTGSMTIATWAQGNIYSGTSTTPTYARSNITPATKPASLLDSSGKILNLPRPQYEAYAPDQSSRQMVPRVMVQRTIPLRSKPYLTNIMDARLFSSMQDPAQYGYCWGDVEPDPGQGNQVQRRQQPSSCAQIRQHGGQGLFESNRYRRQ